jgi:hypothetical protein
VGSVARPAGKRGRRTVENGTGAKGFCAVLISCPAVRDGLLALSGIICWTRSRTFLSITVANALTTEHRQTGAARLPDVASALVDCAGGTRALLTSVC